jgi:galactokinase
MDQSASVFSERGSALFVSFSPRLQARPVQFPKTNPELIFLICQSFVTSDKFVTGPIHYNLRVVECSLAAAYLNAVLNPPGTRLPADASPLGISLHGFQETYFAITEHTTGENKDDAAQLSSLIDLTKQTLTKDEGYTREEIASVLGLSVADLEAQFMSRFPVRAERFKLRQRALHVFSEAQRVLRFMAMLEGDNPELAEQIAAGGDTRAYSEALGALLNESQDSCRDLYECSCDEIDQICDIARKAGAVGSRLTGAGWGGCTVHLVPRDRGVEVATALGMHYYLKRPLTQEQQQTAMVKSTPGSGSAIYLVKDGKL